MKTEISIVNFTCEVLGKTVTFTNKTHLYPDGMKWKIKAGAPSCSHSRRCGVEDSRGFCEWSKCPENLVNKPL